MEPTSRLTRRILLVEDYGANILVAGTLLEIMGYEFEVATDGQDALQKISDNHADYQLVLMDVQMPVLDGYITTAKVREQEARLGLPRLPIVGVTAHALAGDREKCLSAGMDDYLAKPFTKDNLEQKLTRFLGNSQLAVA